MNLDWKRRFGIYGGVATMGLALLTVAGGPAATASTNASGGDVFYEADCTNALSAGVVAPFLIGLNVNATPDAIAPTGATFGATGTVDVPIIGPVLAGSAATGLITTAVGVSTSFTVASTDGTATGTFAYTHTFPTIPAGAIGNAARKITKVIYTAGSTKLTGPASGAVTFGPSDVGMSVAYTNVGNAADKRIDPLTVISAVAANGRSATISIPTLAASAAVGDTLGMGSSVNFTDPAFNTGAAAFTTAGAPGGKANIGITSVTSVTENIAIGLIFGGTPGVEQGTGASRKPACLLTGWGEPGDVPGPLQAGNVPPLTAPLLPAPPATGSGTALVLATGGFVGQPGTTQKITPTAAAFVTLTGGGTTTTTAAPTTTTTAAATTTTTAAATTTTTTGATTTTTGPTTTTTTVGGGGTTTTTTAGGGTTTTTVAPTTTTTVAPTTTTTVAPTTTTTVAPTTTTTAAATTTTTEEPTTTTTAEATTSTTDTTVVTEGSTTTTTVPVVQTTIHGSVTNINQCTSTLDPALQPPADTDVTVSLSTDAFPQPHQGDLITLSNTKSSISIDAGLLQLGVTAGLITDGMKIPSTATLVIAGSSTTEGTHTYTIKGTSTIHVVNGEAQPLVATATLPNTTWHPKNATDPVIFTQKSLKIAAGLDILIGHVDVSIVCSPNGAPVIVALAAQSGDTLPTTTTVVPVTTQGSTTVTTTATPVSSGSLPRTGASTLLLLVVAAIMIDLGVCLVDFGRKRSVRRA